MAGTTPGWKKAHGNRRKSHSVKEEGKRRGDEAHSEKKASGESGGWDTCAPVVVGRVSWRGRLPRSTT